MFINDKPICIICFCFLLDVEEFPRSSSYRRSAERYRDDPRGYKDIPGERYMDESRLYKDTFRDSKHTLKSPLTNGYATLPSDYKYKDKSARIAKEKGFSAEDRDLNYLYERSDKVKDHKGEAEKERMYISESRKHREQSYRDLNGDVSMVMELPRNRERSPERMREYDIPIDSKSEERRHYTSGKK